MIPPAPDDQSAPPPPPAFVATSASEWSPPPDDHALLHQYAHAGSQTAFAELVHRHLDLVYSAARRQVRSPELAEEISQSVFVALARAAADFNPRTPIVAWLHLVTRRSAVDAIRREARRQTREQSAFKLSAMNAAPSSHWSHVAPLLDDALASLNETDRTAVLLRYFENQSLRDVGRTLGTSEDAAQKRVSRALDQLRGSLVKRGLAVTAAGLATSLSAHAIQSAPAALCSAIASATVFSGAAAGSALVAESARTLVMTSLQKTVLVTTLAVVVAGGLGGIALLLWQDRQSQAALQRSEALRAELAQLRRDTDTFNRRHRPVVSAANGQPDAADDALSVQAAAWLARVQKLKAQFAQQPDLAIPELELLTDTQWMELARAEPPPSVEATRKALAAIRTEAKTNFISALREALRSYTAAHADQLPSDPLQLLPHLKPPATAAMLQRYQIVRTGNYADTAIGDALLDERTPIDPDYDSCFALTKVGSSIRPFAAHRSLVIGMQQPLTAFVAANGGQLPKTAAQLLPYFKNPLTPDAQRDFLQAPPGAFHPKSLKRILERNSR